LTALSWCYAANHLGAVCNCLLCVESTLRASKALANYFGVFVDKNSHVIFLRVFSVPLCGEIVEARGGQRKAFSP
jgi:hypothetical protein